MHFYNVILYQIHPIYMLPLAAVSSLVLKTKVVSISVEFNYGGLFLGFPYY